MNAILSLVVAVLYQALSLLSLLLFVYIILSWLEFWQHSNPRTAPRVNLNNPLVRFIEGVAYTVLHPIRRVVEPYQRSTGFDFSPIIAFLLIGLIQRWLTLLVR